MLQVATVQTVVFAFIVPVLDAFFFPGSKHAHVLLEIFFVETYTHIYGHSNTIGLTGLLLIIKNRISSLFSSVAHYLTR
jgi:hypothetical protein